MSASYPIPILASILIGCVLSHAEPPQEKDSVKAEKKITQLHYRITPRIHTKGFFTYGGQVGTDNPSFDINFTFEYKQWGFLVYKGIDLVDHTTDYNFSLIALFRNFKLSDRSYIYSLPRNGPGTKRTFCRHGFRCGVHSNYVREVVAGVHR